MPYVTLMQTERRHQITFDDILYDRVPFYYNSPTARANGTVTFFIERDQSLDKYRHNVNVEQLIATLEMFNAAHKNLFDADRKSLYRTFRIPKRSGGLRQIDEPCPELMSALRELKSIFDDRFNAMYHTSAYAYIRGRSAVDAIKKHQQNQSRWFLKTDFSNFFGNTTEDFLWRMITQIFPFSEVAKSERGASALRKALSLAFLNGGLPQGTPISPELTTLCMLPFDHKVTNALRKRGYIYTRYADDIQISHRESFDWRAACKWIDDVLRSFGAPFSIKPSKTRYGSTSGKNWNLGVMLNKDNKITIGRKNKERLKAACANYIRDKRDGVQWDPHDVYVLLGKISYYKMVERDYIEGFTKWFNEKNGVNLMRMLRDETR